MKQTANMGMSSLNEGWFAPSPVSGFESFFINNLTDLPHKAFRSVSNGIIIGIVIVSLIGIG